MNNYIAWMNHADRAPDGGVRSIGTSVARGTLKQVKKRAKEIAATEMWREFHPNGTKITITRGAKQLFAAAFIVE